MILEGTSSVSLPSETVIGVIGCVHTDLFLKQAGKGRRTTSGISEPMTFCVKASQA